MPQTRISTGGIAGHEAKTKDLVLEKLKGPLRERGFQVDQPQSILMEWDTDDRGKPWLRVLQPDGEISGRVPLSDPLLQQHLYAIRDIFLGLKQALAGLNEGYREPAKLGTIGRQGVERVGHLRDFLEMHGDDRALVVAELEGISGGTESGWVDEAGCYLDLMGKVMRLMGLVREDIG